MRIGELARRAGTTTSALRYYEQVGVLQPTRRTVTGYRLYGPGAIGRLAFLRRARALGLSLGEVHRLLAERRAETAADRDPLRHLVAHKLAETRRRAAELQALERELQSMYVRLLRAPGPECGHLGDCACWLPTDEEVKVMTDEVTCCDTSCCPSCACASGGPCDCPDCPCNRT
jgi:DNA-binding transcriptional MerR regulator